MPHHSQLSEQSSETSALLAEQAGGEDRPWFYMMHHAALRTYRETEITIKATLFYSSANFLLPLLPLGIVAAKYDWSPALVFTINFLAMFPLASMLTFSTEQLAAKVGSILGGLINATFGNAVEMIVGISALKEGEIRIVQSSMIGSIISSTLLILGSCFFLGGLGKKTVDINVDVAGILASLMIISSASLIIPTAMHIIDQPSDSSQPNDHILSLSRVASIILLVFYILYVYFQTWSHAYLFNECNEEEESGGAELTILASSLVLIISTVAVAICSDYLVDSVDGFVETLGVSRAFIGLIIVPIVGNAGEYVSTVKWARSNMINLAIGVIAGATLQISLFVTPFLVILGWIMHQPMSLQFDTFETTVLTMSVLVVNCLVRNGQTNYFSGILLIGTYVIVAIAFYVHPDDNASNLMPTTVA